MTVYGGDIIYASDLNGIEDRLPVTYVKTTTKAVTSSTTLADDNELINIPLGIGTFTVELILYLTFAAASVGIKTRWAFSGTWNGASAFRSCFGPGSTNTSTSNTAVTPSTISAFTLDSQDAIYSAGNISAYTTAREYAANVVVTVAGNLKLTWAQNASSASAVNVRQNSQFTVTQLA